MVASKIRVIVNIELLLQDITGEEFGADFDNVVLEMPVDAQDWDDMSTDEREEVIYEEVVDILHINPQVEGG